MLRNTHVITLRYYDVMWGKPKKLGILHRRLLSSQMRRRVVWKIVAKCSKKTPSMFFIASQIIMYLFTAVRTSNLEYAQKLASKLLIY
jgi:hypothetical protein